MSVRFLFLLFFFCLVSLFAGAMEQDIQIELLEDGSANVVHSVRWGEDENLFFPILLDPVQSIRVISHGAEVPFAYSNRIIQLSALPEKEMQVSYATRALTDKNKEEWLLKISDWPAHLERLTILLPPNTQIHSFSPGAIIFFESPHLMAVWNKKDPFPSGVQLTYSHYSANNADYSWVVFLGAVLLAVGFVFWRYSVGAKTQQGIEPLSTQTPSFFSDRQNEIIRTLPEKEKRILEYLAGNEGCTQKTLEQKTGLSKATLSRALKNLEQKNILQLTPDGYSNRVYFQPWFKKNEKDP